MVFQIVLIWNWNGYPMEIWNSIETRSCKFQTKIDLKLIEIEFIQVEKYDYWNHIWI